jgi:GT2 family glycosyltransferase
VTVVVVTWQGAHLLPACLDSLRRQTLQHRLVVVDNASTDGTSDVLSRYPEVTVVRTERNLGFAGGVDVGLRAAGTELVALLNNDATAEPRWLEELVTSAQEHPEAAAITSLMVLAGTRPPVTNNAGVVLLDSGYGTDRGYGLPVGALAEPEEVFGFSGGAALLRSSAVEAVGGFPRHFFLYYEDTDLSWRLRLAGWTIRYEPAAVVHHQHSATVDQQSDRFAFYNERNRLLMLVRCASAGVALSALGRFLVTTASLAVRRVTRPGRSLPANQRVPLRLRVLASFARRLPAELWARRHIRARAPRGLTGTRTVSPQIGRDAPPAA